MFNKNTQNNTKKRQNKMINENKEIQNKLTKGLLDLIILQLLAVQPMHGYEILTTVRKNFGVYFGASTVYPILNSMEKRKYLKSQWDMSSERARKVYTLTSDGKTVLNYTVGSLRTICKTLGTDRQTHNTIKPIVFSVAENSWNKQKVSSVKVAHS
jgi:PadR family transcriptional regulator PadR